MISWNNCDNQQISLSYTAYPSLSNISLPFPPSMSTTSTVTASVAHDHIPGDGTKLLNWMCVLVLTRGHGTPFDATSIQEEDIIKLCVEMKQTHPEGVLWFLATESVIFFCSSDKMLATVCRATKAMVLHEEPIRLCTSPPSTTHLRAYIAVRDGQPSGTQSLTPDREEIPQPSPSNPHPDGRTQCQFHMNLGDAQLRQLMEDIQQEVAQRELNAPPGTHLQAAGGTPAGDRDPDVDDEEVTFPRGRGWEPQGQPHLPTDPPQPDNDVGCLINTLATGLQLGTPRINTFSAKPCRKDRSVFWTMVPWGTMC